ncbi:MAG: TlpA disulfide reductase family protein, partial [Bacteroidota bacterium]
MKNTLLFCLILVLGACQNEPSAPSVAATTSPVVKNKGAMQTVAPKKVSRKVNRDSIKPKVINRNFARDQSRHKSEIQQKFPYDIDLKKADGSVVNSSAILGVKDKPTVLLFWLTTCFPCSMEMAAIAKKYRSWQEEADFELVALSTDFQKNYPKFVQRVEEKQWPWPSYNDVNREFRKVMPGGLNGLPQTFLLDQKGQIVYHKRKYASGDEDKLFAKIK